MAWVKGRGQVEDKTPPFWRSVLQSHSTQKKKTNTEEAGEREGEKKSLLPDKKWQTPCILHIVSSVSKALLFILYTSLVIWCPNHRRLKTANEKEETSQLVERNLQNKDQTVKKAWQRTSREKRL